MTRTFSVLGDSISTFEGITPDGWRVFYEAERREATGVLNAEDTWWSHVINHFGGTLHANAAWSGCVVEGELFPAGASKERIEALEKGGTAPSDVLVYIGINDYGWGSAEAQVVAGKPSAPAELVAACTHVGDVAGMAPENAIDGFAESYARMLRRIKERYPHATVWCATLAPGRVSGNRVSTSPRNFRGICIDRYNDAIASAANSTGCRLVDLAALGFDYDAVDGTHPSAKGMKQLAAMFIRGMRAADPSTTNEPFEGEALLTEDMRTTDFCAKPCVGCEFARSTGNDWFHVCEKQIGK